eukprot:CAMPEP_0194308534 /NCGR_PEP_ID=MMETSP0171-20130528/5500_1 /TAXON_ID=218684 /ORGANISM="Corethron pennatum, Strain L29A3" /LENGTH=178 /DNA_ID=CAMNT_0039061221 /DNA_START=83 /DNA_END=616 /DNA_ORIENTATION=-
MQALLQEQRDMQTITSDGRETNEGEGYGSCGRINFSGDNNITSHNMKTDIMEPGMGFCDRFFSLFIFFSVVGGFFITGLAIGIPTLISSIEEIEDTTWIEASGKIVGFTPCDYDDDYFGSNDALAAVVDYVVDGVTYSFSKSRCFYKKPKIGTEVRLWYDPENVSGGNDVNGTFEDLW